MNLKWGVLILLGCLFLKYRISFCFQEFSLVFHMRACVLQHDFIYFCKELLITWCRPVWVVCCGWSPWSLLIQPLDSAEVFPIFLAHYASVKLNCFIEIFRHQKLTFNKIFIAHVAVLFGSTFGWKLLTHFLFLFLFVSPIFFKHTGFYLKKELVCPFCFHCILMFEVLLDICFWWDCHLMLLELFCRRASTGCELEFWCEMWGCGLLIQECWQRIQRLPFPKNRMIGVRICAYDVLQESVRFSDTLAGFVCLLSGLATVSVGGGTECAGFFRELGKSSRGPVEPVPETPVLTP